MAMRQPTRRPAVGTSTVWIEPAPLELGGQGVELLGAAVAVEHGVLGGAVEPVGPGGADGVEQRAGIAGDALAEHELDGAERVVAPGDAGVDVLEPDASAAPSRAA